MGASLPRRTLGLIALALAGCSAQAPAPTPRGEARVAPASGGEIAQSDVNRMATLAMRDNLDGLLRLADKLYRRNPAEWRKSAASRESAVQRLRDSVEARTPWAELRGRRDIAALSFSLSADFQGDRVAAFVHASADMLITAHGGKTSFYLVDGLDAQHLYNAARNVEIAVWMLANRRAANGQLLLLADEIGEQGRNLSFEREFGKVIARLDLLSQVVAEKYRRAVIGYVQSFVGGTFMQFLPVR
jgi:hypothetical protein